MRGAREGRERKRRTQAERSATTRTRLLDAAVECLLELGYGRTTTIEVAKRAGLSRGAQLHHFPSKAELMTAAVERVFTRRQDEFMRAFGKLPASADPASSAIDLLWSIIGDRSFFAWLELVIASRTEPDLLAHVSALTLRFDAEVERTFRELFTPAEPAGPLFHFAPRLAFLLLEGLALRRALVPKGPDVEEALSGLKMLFGAAIKGG